MGKRTEQAQLNKDKMDAIRESIVKDKIIPYMQETEKKKDIIFDAKIVPFGPPQVGVRWAKKPEKKLLEIGASKYEDRTKAILDQIFKNFVFFCNEQGVLPYGIITPFGATMEFKLTEKKQKEVLDGMRTSPK